MTLLSLFLVGATGRMGGRLLAEALAEGHAVTALVRAPARLTVRHPNLRVVVGDVTDAALLRTVLAGHDAVVSALGTRRGQEPYDVLPRGMAALLAAMTDTGVRRIVSVASAGILQADATTLRRDMPGYPAAFRTSSAAHLDAVTQLMASGLDWTVIGPPELVAGEREQPLAWLVDYLPPGPKRVSMEALARLIIAELGHNRFVHQRLGVNDASETVDASG